MRQARFVDDAPATLEIDLPSFSQFDPAGRPVQEAEPDCLLQKADPSGQGRIRHAERLGRAAEAPGLNDLHEQRHVVHLIAFIPPS
jgi:hypothetical protein